MDTVTPGRRSARLALAFACVGHAQSHLFAPVFFVAALSLEREFRLTHGETVTLIVAGNMLYGIAAPLAGWLGDRWSSAGMIALFFFGTGGGMVATGLAPGPRSIALSLAFTGLFASIYHPVGMAWLVRNTRSWGRALGINGVFGAIGAASAALSAGVLIDLAGWRAAFLLPGLLVIATGALFSGLLLTGLIGDGTSEQQPSPQPPAFAVRRALAVLCVTMLCTGLIYQATQAALPKLFAERLDGALDHGFISVSALVAFVYLASGAVQILGGWLADRLPMKSVYLVCFVLQVPVLLLAAVAGGGALLLIVFLMVSFNAGGLPAENALVARYAPPDRRGLAFGLKFILAFGVSGLGVYLEGSLYDFTNGFGWLFVMLGALASVGVAVGLLLPAERSRARLSAADEAVERGGAQAYPAVSGPSLSVAAQGDALPGARSSAG